MDFTAVIIGAAVIGILGLLVGIFLGVSEKKLGVETDPREEQIMEALPKTNCGGCGFASCSALAKALVDGDAPVNACVVGGNPVAAEIANILGKEMVEVVHHVARVKCSGDCTSAGNRSIYTGINDCRYAMMSPSTSGKACVYGCLGLGNCVSVCPEQAIQIVNGIAKVDEDICHGCGECSRACPKGLIEIVSETNKAFVACLSKDKLKDVKAVCSAGCIGCGVCAKLCPEKAIIMENNLPVVDTSKCTGCGICAGKCPAKVIHVL